jgi:hypothetical protein
LFFLVVSHVRPLATPSIQPFVSVPNV